MNFRTRTQTFELLTKVCDGYGFCNQAYIGQPMTVGKNSDLNSETVRALGDLAGAYAADLQPLSALGLLRKLTATLMASADLWQQLGFPTCSLTCHLYNNSAAELADDMDLVDVEEATELAQLMSGSECFSFNPKDAKERRELKNDKLEVITKTRRLRRKIKECISDPSKGNLKR